MATDSADFHRHLADLWDEFRLWPEPSLLAVALAREIHAKPPSWAWAQDFNLHTHRSQVPAARSVRCRFWKAPRQSANAISLQ